MSISRQKHGAQHPAFEKLTLEQRAAVHAWLLGECGHAVPASRETMLDHVRLCMKITPARWAEKKVQKSWNRQLDEAIEGVIRAPDPDPVDREDDDADDWDDEEPAKSKKKSKTAPLGPKKGAPKQETKARNEEDWNQNFAAIPYPLIDRLLRALPEVAFKVYVALLRHEGYASHEMCPGQDTLAFLTGLGERSVWNGIGVLREAGLVTDRRRFNTSNVYTLVKVTPENWAGILTNLERLSKKLHPAETRKRWKREPKLQARIAERARRRGYQSRTTVRITSAPLCESLTHHRAD